MTTRRGLMTLLAMAPAGKDNGADFGQYHRLGTGPF
jgi:hypothetical protein